MEHFAQLVQCNLLCSGHAYVIPAVIAIVVLVAMPDAIPALIEGPCAGAVAIPVPV